MCPCGRFRPDCPCGCGPSGQLCEPNWSLVRSTIGISAARGSLGPLLRRHVVSGKHHKNDFGKGNRRPKKFSFPVWSFNKRKKTIRCSSR